MRRRFYQALATTYIEGSGLFTTVVCETGSIYCFGSHTDGRGPYWEQLPPVPTEVEGQYLNDNQ